MAIMMGSLYTALVEGGSTPDPAKKAAEEVADYQKQPADIRSDLAVMKAMLGIIVAGLLALIVKTFFG